MNKIEYYNLKDVICSSKNNTLNGRQANVN